MREGLYQGAREEAPSEAAAVTGTGRQSPAKKMEGKREAQLGAHLSSLPRSGQPLKVLPRPASTLGHTSGPAAEVSVPEVWGGGGEGHGLRVGQIPAGQPPSPSPS